MPTWTCTRNSRHPPQARCAEWPAMTEDDAELSGCSLLGVFAHPDDESLACGGLLAMCTHLGARVSVCCATGGELGATAGMTSHPEPVDVRNVRLRELRNASRVLGVTDLIVLDHEDG